MKTLRSSQTWKMIYKGLQTVNVADRLINAIVSYRKNLVLNTKELEALTTAYDYMIMYEALNLKIKGEDTDNTKIVADIIYRYWEAIGFGFEFNFEQQDI